MARLCEVGIAFLQGGEQSTILVFGQRTPLRRGWPGKNDVSRNIVLREGKVQFSATGVGGAYLAQEGVFEFGARAWGPQPIRMLLLNRSDQALSVMTAADANVKTLGDLKGKRVAWVIGSPSLNQNITALLAFAGLDWDDVKKIEFGGYGAAMDGLLNNQVDAAFASSVAGQLYQIAASPRGLRHPVVPHDDKEGWQRLTSRAPYYVQVMATEGAIRYFEEIGVWKPEYRAHNDALIERQKVLAQAWQSVLDQKIDDDQAFGKAWMKARAEALEKAGLDVVTSSW